MSTGDMALSTGQGREKLGIVVYSQYYRTKTADRQIEIDECLRNNLNHPLISKVVLFRESDAPPLPRGTVPVEVIENNNRITYAEWFRYVRRQSSGIALLLNADIYLDTGVDVLAKTFDSANVFLALTRYNPGHAGFHLNDYPHWTQDVWGVRADAELPESLLYASSFPLGFPGCDNRIAYVMWSHGFQVRNPCYHVRSVHLQASTARGYDKTSDRLYGGVSYVHPSLSPTEDAELEFTVWSRSYQRPTGVLINQQAIEEGVHQLRHSDADIASRFVNQQRFTGMSWVNEAIGSAHLQTVDDLAISEDTVYMRMELLAGKGCRLNIIQATPIKGFSFRLPLGAPDGFRLNLEIERQTNEGSIERHMHRIELPEGGQRVFYETESLSAFDWQAISLTLELAGEPAKWTEDAGAELVVFGAEGALAFAKSLNVIAEREDDQVLEESQKEITGNEEQKDEKPLSTCYLRGEELKAACHSGTVKYEYMDRFRVIGWQNGYLFHDRFWPSARYIPETDLLGIFEDRVRLFLFGFCQPTLEMWPDWVKSTKTHQADYLFWQYPCRTEGDALDVHKVFAEPIIDDETLHMYVGLPWATFIDLNVSPKRILQLYKARLTAIRQVLANFSLTMVVHTVCQHILWEQHTSLFKGAGIDTLWLSHKPAQSDYCKGLALKPWHLFAVNAREENRKSSLTIRPPHEKPWLASFMGAYMPHYISEVRKKLTCLQDIHRFYIRLTDEWHFNPVVYGEQVGDSLYWDTSKKVVACDNERYNVLLSDSVFSLCPSGAGPNSLRLWESLAVGTIPVIISDSLVLPDIAEVTNGEINSWDEVIIAVREDDVERVPDMLGQLSEHEVKTRSAKCLIVYKAIHQSTCFGRQSERQVPKLETSSRSVRTKPLITIPVYGPTDRYYWRRKKHAFYDVTIEWYLRGYIDIQFGDKGFFWLGKAGDILLMERDNVNDMLDGKVDPPRWSGYVPYKYAIFYCQHNISSHRNINADSYFTYNPNYIEAKRASVGRRPFAGRDIGSLFAGSVENEIQEFYRSPFSSWEKHIDIYACTDKLHKNEPHKYSMVEYIDMVTRSKYGVCFRGNGPKAMREIELLALGTPLIITEGVDVSYPEPLIEGVHYFKAVKPSDIPEIVATTTEEQWEAMSQACWDWFERHGTMAKMYETLIWKTASLDLYATRHQTIRIRAKRAEAADSLAVKSLHIVDPTANWVTTEDTDLTTNALDIEPDYLIVNELPLVGRENDYIWNLPPAEHHAFCKEHADSCLETHKQLLTLLGYRTRNYRITLHGSDGELDLWERITPNGILLEDDHESAILSIDYDCKRRCAGAYPHKHIEIKGPAVIRQPLVSAMVHYERQGESFTADISDSFNDYLAINGELIPEESAMEACKLWMFENASIKRIDISVICDGFNAQSINDVSYVDVRWPAKK